MHCILLPRRDIHHMTALLQLPSGHVDPYISTDSSESRAELTLSSSLSCNRMIKQVVSSLHSIIIDDARSVVRVDSRDQQLHHYTIVSICVCRSAQAEENEKPNLPNTMK